MKYISFLIVASVLLAVGCSEPTTANYERFYFRHDGADLAVEVNGDIGSGTFILLLHGGPGGSGFEYNTGLYTEILEREYAMVYLDQRGQGSSKGNYDESTITLQQFSDDIEALVAFLKEKYGASISVFLMGHSWGGTTGTHALVNTDVQQNLNGWIEVGGAHDIPLLYKESVKMFIEIGEDQIAQGKNTEKWQEIVDYSAAIDTNNVSDEASGQLNSYGFEAEGLIEEIREAAPGGVSQYSFTNSPMFTLTGFVSGNLTSGVITPETEKTALTDQLDKVTIPTLLMWGKYDFVVPPALGTTALEALGSTEKQLMIFEESGHSPMDNEGQNFANAVIDFVDQHK